MDNNIATPPSSSSMRLCHTTIDFSTSSTQKLFKGAAKGIDEKEKHKTGTKSLLLFLRNSELQAIFFGFVAIS